MRSLAIALPLLCLLASATTYAWWATTRVEPASATYPGIPAENLVSSLKTAIRLNGEGAASANCAEPQARQFDFWIGEWTIRQKILEEDGTYLELPAKTSVSVALDGCALIEHWEGKVQFFWEGMTKPELMQGLSVRAYDPRTGKWYIHWIDTRTRRFDAPYIGNFAAGKGVFYREWQAAEGMRVGRITFSAILSDAVRWTLEISRDGQQSWTTVWIMEMRRVGKLETQ